MECSDEKQQGKCIYVYMKNHPTSLKSRTSFALRGSSKNTHTDTKQTKRTPTVCVLKLKIVLVGIGRPPLQFRGSIMIPRPTSDDVCVRLCTRALVSLYCEVESLLISHQQRKKDTSPTPTGRTGRTAPTPDDYDDGDDFSTQVGTTNLCKQGAASSLRLIGPQRPKLY